MGSGAWGRGWGGCALETILKQRLRFGPNAAFVAAEDDGDDMATVAMRTRNQTMPAGDRIAGFHAVALRHRAQDAVGVC